MSKQEARAERINEWLEHLHRWEAAGGSLASYAKEQGLALWALYRRRGVLIRAAGNQGSHRGTPRLVSKRFRYRLPAWL